MDRGDGYDRRGQGRICRVWMWILKGKLELRVQSLCLPANGEPFAEMNTGGRMGFYTLSREAGSLRGPRADDAPNNG